MTLSDIDISRALHSGGLVVAPLGPDAIQPCSIDVRLGTHLRLLEPYSYINPGADCWGQTSEYPIPETDWPMKPGAFLLGSTMERVEIPADLVCFVEGRSSLGRVGLVVHLTAGLIDPGFRGQITLELANSGPSTIWLRAGMPIGQLAFSRLSSPSRRPYGPDRGSRYQGQQGPTGARP